VLGRREPADARVLDRSNVLGTRRRDSCTRGFPEAGGNPARHLFATVAPDIIASIRVLGTCGVNRLPITDVRAVGAGEFDTITLNLRPRAHADKCAYPQRWLLRLGADISAHPAGFAPGVSGIVASCRCQERVQVSASTERPSLVPSADPCPLSAGTREPPLV